MAKIGLCVWGSWSDAGDAAVKYLLHSGGGREVAGQGWTMALGWREYQASLGSDATDARLGPWHPTDQHCPQNIPFVQLVTMIKYPQILAAIYLSHDESY